MNRLVAPWLAVGCSEFDLSNLGDPNAGAGPDILVEPPALTYGLLAAGEVEEQSFTVTNVGTSALRVSEVVVAAGLGFAVDPASRAFALEPEESVVVPVTFTPMGAGDNHGRVEVWSDDPDDPSAPVDLLGRGDVPELRIDPATYVFPTTSVPCGAEVPLTLTNVGTQDLVISDLEYTSGGALTLDAEGLLGELPLTLAPGGQREVVVSFTAADVVTDSGALEVWSTDPRGVVRADQNAEGLYEDEATERFTEPGIPPVDVLMLIDQSCSMEGDNIDDVEGGMPAFVDNLSQVADWQLVQVTGADGCANGGVLDATDKDAAETLIANAFALAPIDPVAEPFTEALLSHAATALSLTDPGECNEGFLRPGALLHLLLLSDEPEQSGVPWDAWVAALELYAVAPEFLKISAVVDLAGCGEGPAGYVEAAAATGGVTLNICDAEWGAGLEDLAGQVLEGSRTYNLSEPAVASSVEVDINGVAAVAFTYVAEANAVTVTAPTIGEGDLVEIRYAVAATCSL